MRKRSTSRRFVARKFTLWTGLASSWTVWALVPISGYLVRPATGQVIDLSDLPNYAGQPRPGYINRDNTPPNNPISDAGATLGRVLFYDPRLSVSGDVSCASCHQQRHAFSDPAQVSRGVNGTTGRHAMRLINARFANERRFFWDERATSLEEQTTRPIQDHAEMGFSGQNGDPGLGELIRSLEELPEYQRLFSLVFGDSHITETRMQRALAQFVRSIQSFDSKYDAGRAQVGNDNAPFPNFSPQENRGKDLFLQRPIFDPAGRRVGGGAGCAGCHRPPEFDIDPQSLNNGIIAAIGGGEDLTNTRAPSLRDILDEAGNPHGGFMHNGGAGIAATVQGVINHYDRIPLQPGNTQLDPRLRPNGNPQNLRLSDGEKDDLAAFLRTLTGRVVYTDAKWSNPFGDHGELTLLPLPALGDLTCDHLVDVRDVAPFVQSLVDPAGYGAAHPGCDPARGDLDQNGRNDGRDVGAFVAAILSP